MDPELILAKIQRAVPFDERNYPGYDSLTRNQQYIFALTHMLRHGAKSLLAYEDAKGDGRETLIYKLTLNSFRFGQMARLPQGILETEMSNWGKSRIGLAFSQRAAESDTVTSLKEETLRAMALFEDAEHGGELSLVMPKVWTSAKAFIQGARGLSRLRKLTNERLDAWLDGHIVKHGV